MERDGMTERGADYDEARAAYLAAREELARLYDTPDKTVYVQVYRGQLRRAQANVTRTHKAMVDGWVGA